MKKKKVLIGLAVVCGVGLLSFGILQFSKYIGKTIDNKVDDLDKKIPKENLLAEEDFTDDTDVSELITETEEPSEEEPSEEDIEDTSDDEIVYHEVYYHGDGEGDPSSDEEVEAVPNYGVYKEGFWDRTPQSAEDTELPIDSMNIDYILLGLISGYAGDCDYITKDCKVAIKYGFFPNVEVVAVIRNSYFSADDKFGDFTATAQIKTDGKWIEREILYTIDRESWLISRLLVSDTDN